MHDVMSTNQMLPAASIASAVDDMLLTSMVLEDYRVHIGTNRKDKVLNHVSDTRQGH